jgi:hypothetical protein
VQGTRHQGRVCVSPRRGSRPPAHNAGRRPGGGTTPLNSTSCRRGHTGSHHRRPASGEGRHREARGGQRQQDRFGCHTPHAHSSRPSAAAAISQTRPLRHGQSGAAATPAAPSMHTLLRIGASSNAPHPSSVEQRGCCHSCCCCCCWCSSSCRSKLYPRPAQPAPAGGRPSSASGPATATPCGATTDNTPRPSALAHTQPCPCALLGSGQGQGDHRRPAAASCEAGGRRAQAHCNRPPPRRLPSRGWDEMRPAPDGRGHLPKAPMPHSFQHCVVRAATRAAACAGCQAAAVGEEGGCGGAEATKPLALHHADWVCATPRFTNHPSHAACLAAGAMLALSPVCPA